MDIKFTKQELKLYDSRNPGEYIDNSLKSKLKSGHKAWITKLWLKKTGYSVEDIKYARNRHPYWRKKKCAGSLERTKRRMHEHDYSDGYLAVWDKQTLSEFIKMNKMDKKGRYINKDYQLAEHFSTTIPSIQYLRRKYNMAVKLLNRDKTNITAKRIYDYIVRSEQVIKKFFKKKKKR